MSRLEESIKQWKILSEDYPYFAESGTGLRPHMIDPEVYGHHICCVFTPNRRTWAFSKQSDRDRFVNVFRPRGVFPCGNPHPKEVSEN